MRNCLKLKFHWTSFPDTSSRTCWRRRQLPRNKLATSYEEVSDTPDHLDMSRWSESRQLPRNFLVTSWRLPRNICYGEVTGKLVPVKFELYSALVGRLTSLSPLFGQRPFNVVVMRPNTRLRSAVIPPNDGLFNARCCYGHLIII